jgi:hypothetical protein
VAADVADVEVVGAAELDEAGFDEAVEDAC